MEHHYFHNLHYEKFPDGTVKCIEDEIPFELPEGWEWTRLESVFKLSSGKAIKVRQLEDDGEYPVYGGNGINGLYSMYNVESETIIIGRVGFYCGSVYKTTSQAWVTDNALIASITEPSFYQIDFLCNLLKYLDLGKTSVSTAQPVVSGKGIYPLLVPIPPLDEQKRIVTKLNDCVSIVDVLESDNSDLQTTIQLTKSKILDLAIRGKLIPQNPDDEPASVLLDRVRAEKEELIKQGKIKRDKKESVIYKGDDNSYYEKIGDTVTCIDEELPFDIPDNWAWIRLSSACIINPKNSIADDTIVSFVPMTLIQDGYANEFTFEQRKWGEVKKGFTHFAENDVGFAKITPCFENRKSVVFRGLCNGYGAGTTELHILRAYPDTILPEYFLYLVKTESFISGGKQTFSGAVGQQRVGKEYVYNYFCPVPPLSEQQRIIKKCSDIMTMLNSIEKSLS